MKCSAHLVFLLITCSRRDFETLFKEFIFPLSSVSITPKANNWGMPTPGQHWTMPIAHGVWDNQINDWIVGWYSGMVHPIDLTWDCRIRKTGLERCAHHWNRNSVIFPRSMYCNPCTWAHHMCWLTHCYTMSHVLTYTHCSTMLHVLAYTYLHTVVNTNHLLRHSSAIWSTHRHDHRRSGFHRHTPISCCASYSSAQFHNHFDIKLANTRCFPMQDRKIAPPGAQW